MAGKQGREKHVSFYMQDLRIFVLRLEDQYSYASQFEANDYICKEWRAAFNRSDTIEN